MSRRQQPRLPSQSMGRVVALAVLLLAGAFVIAGPTGIFAWSENTRLLSQREEELAKLSSERDVLKNRVDLLDPRNADPDLVGELLRSKLNVAHPDEVVLARH